MSFIIVGKVESEVRFAEFQRAVELRLNAALVEWAALLLEAVHETAPVGHRPDFDRRAISPGVHLRDTFKSAAFMRGGFGVVFPEVVVWSDSPNALWQQSGTRSRRKKKLKAGGRNTTPGARGDRGTPPTYFISRALRNTFPAGMRLVQEAIEGVASVESRTKLTRAITSMTKPASVDTTTPQYVNRPSL